MARTQCLSSSAAFLLVLLAVPLLHCTRLAQAAVDAGAPVSTPTGGEGSLRPEQCAGACDFRCSKAHAHNNCLFFCNMCCEKCLCVPSGTFGNKEECPCYNNWKTKKGGPKCP